MNRPTQGATRVLQVTTEPQMATDGRCPDNCSKEQEIDLRLNPATQPD